jgi:hypothetical protein
VDTNGLIMQVLVHEASIQDHNGGKLLLAPLKGNFPRLKLIWADSAYNKGGFVEWVKATLVRLHETFCVRSSACSQPKEPQTYCLRTFAVKSHAGSIIAREPETPFGSLRLRKAALGGKEAWDNAQALSPHAPFPRLNRMQTCSTFPPSSHAASIAPC